MNLSARVPEASYLFAYDIGDAKRARRVRQCLQRWRVGGQLSVHETRLRPVQARELGAELLGYVDRKADALLLSRLSQRGQGPIYTLTPRQASPVVGRVMPNALPQQLQAGWYLLAYDIRDELRLQRIHRRTAKVCLYLQRSVYLYHGVARPLHALLRELEPELQRPHDDVRLYALAGPHELWFLSGPLPPLASLQTQAAASALPPASLLQRLRTWLGG